MSASLDRQALVAALRAVEGVLDADVEPDAEGGLGTLRLDLRPGVDEAAVAKQVSIVLREQFGLGVDEDRVAVLAAAEAETTVVDVTAAETDDVTDTQVMAVPAPRDGVRPKVSKVHVVAAGLDITASVTLASGGRVVVGEAKGLASQSGTHRAVATATLRAVEQLVGDSLRTELDHLEVAPIGGMRTALVRLTLLSAQGSETLTGVAVVRDDVRQAVIRATLDALNRRLELLLTEL